MKKTLFLLVSAALVAPMAMADTLWTTTFGNADQSDAAAVTLTNSLTGINGAVTALTTTSGGSALSLLTDGALGGDASLFTPNSNVNSGTPWQVVFSFTNATETAYTLTGFDAAMFAFSSSGAIQGGARNVNVSGSVAVADDVRTFTQMNALMTGNTTSGFKGTASFTFDALELGAGETLVVTLTTARGTSTGGQTANPSFFGIETMSVTGAAVVPEPTTATLSLLALAGLAARRRRK